MWPENFAFGGESHEMVPSTRLSDSRHKDARYKSHDDAAAVVAAGGTDVDEDVFGRSEDGRVYGDRVRLDE